MTRYTVNEVATMTQYTARQIRRECSLGRLKARLLPSTGGQWGYAIDKEDYLSWMAMPSTQRRRWRGKRGMRK